MDSNQEKVLYVENVSKTIKSGEVLKDIVNKTIKFEKIIRIIAIIFTRISSFLALIFFIGVIGVSFLYILDDRDINEFLHAEFWYYILIALSIFLLIGFFIFGIWSVRTYKLINKETGTEFGLFIGLFLDFIFPIRNIIYSYRFIRDTLKIFLGSNDSKINNIADTYQEGIVGFHIFLSVHIVILIKYGIEIGAFWAVLVPFCLFSCFFNILSPIKDCIDVIIEEHKKLL